jgi:cell filamentation protein
LPNYTYSADLNSAVKNKLGATTFDQLEQREGKFIFARMAEIEMGAGPKGNFDAAHLKALHRHIFQDVYEWAGKSRDEQVRLSDGTIATEPAMRKLGGKPFMEGHLIPDALDQIARALRATNFLRDLPRQQFAEYAADVLLAINAVHPFREGNGRSQRLFVSELAKAAGHDLDFSVVSQERMIQASIAGNEDGNKTTMRRLFVEINNPHRVAALIPAIASMERNGFPWNDQYVATLEPGQNLAVTMVGVAGPHFMARTGTAILVGQEADLPSPAPNSGQGFQISPSPWPAPDDRLVPSPRSGLSPGM